MVDSGTLSMDETSAGSNLDLGYGAWIGFWLQLIVLGACALLGAFYASADVDAGDYACGLILIVAALVLALMRLKARFDGRSADWADFVLVNDLRNLILAIVAFVILGLGGLIVAAGVDYGGLHNGGVALFVVSAVTVLLNIKRVFDNLDRHR